MLIQAQEQTVIQLIQKLKNEIDNFLIYNKGSKIINAIFLKIRSIPHCYDSSKEYTSLLFSCIIEILKNNNFPIENKYEALQNISYITNLEQKVDYFPILNEIISFCQKKQSLSYQNSLAHCCLQLFGNISLEHQNYRHYILNFGILDYLIECFYTKLLQKPALWCLKNLYFFNLRIQDQQEQFNFLYEEKFQKAANYVLFCGNSHIQSEIVTFLAYISNTQKFLGFIPKLLLTTLEPKVELQCMFLTILTNCLPFQSQIILDNHQKVLQLFNSVIQRQEQIIVRELLFFLSNYITINSFSHDSIANTCNFHLINLLRQQYNINLENNQFIQTIRQPIQVCLRLELCRYFYTMFTLQNNKYLLIAIQHENWIIELFQEILNYCVPYSQNETFMRQIIQNSQNLQKTITNK